MAFFETLGFVILFVVVPIVVLWGWFKRGALKPTSGPSFPTYNIDGSFARVVSVSWA